MPSDIGEEEVGGTGSLWQREGEVCAGLTSLKENPTPN